MRSILFKKFDGYVVGSVFFEEVQCALKSFHTAVEIFKAESAGCDCRGVKGGAVVGDVKSDFSFGFRQAYRCAGGCAVMAQVSGPFLDDAVEVD